MAEDKKKEIDVAVIEVTEEYLKEKLYKIRGKRVLLDADLAEIYGYDTKGFNRQVKNNIEKFDEDFMFELTDEELEDLRYKNCTANISSKSRYNPHVFTEQGLYMLMTVLKGPLAVKQSKALIRTFKKMKDYILENRDLIGQREILQLSMEAANNRIEINKINSDMISLEKQISDVAEGLKDVVTKSELADMMNSFVSDDEEKILYIYWEYYKNQMTDDKTAIEIAEFKESKESFSFGWKMLIYYIAHNGIKNGISQKLKPFIVQWPSFRIAPRHALMHESELVIVNVLRITSDNRI